MACHTPPGEPTQQFPDKIHLILMRFNFDESHQKELIKYHFLSAFAYSVTVAHAQTYQPPPPPPPQEKRPGTKFKVSFALTQRVWHTYTPYSYTQISI